MKLTKAQRLFMKAGEAQCLMKNSRIGCIKANHRKERKKLICEALRAYELEIGDAFSAGGALMRGISEDAPMVIEDDDQTIIF